MVYAYRVRGPYATAIAKMVIDFGHKLVDLSDRLAQRFELPQNSEEPPQATVKTSDDDANTLVIVGLRKAVEEILNALISSIPYVGYEYNRYGPYTTIAVKVKGVRDGQCLAEYEGVDVLIQEYRRCVEGEKAVVHIVKPATLSNRMAVAFPGASVLRDTLVLIDDGAGRVFFSEHIKNAERKAMLLALSNHVVRKGYSIRWRSSAKSVPLERIAKDLEDALGEIERLRSVDSAVEGGLVDGEAIAFVRLSRLSKEYLDSVRNKVVPTAPGHHSMRTCGRYSDVVDLLDVMSKYVDREALGRALRYAVTEMVIGKPFTIVHRKPSGEKIRIGPVEIVGALDSEFGKVLVGKRVIKSNGVYDGLEVPKERGDVAVSVIPIDAWFIVHRYVGVGGEEKGIYININTPPEVCPDDKTIDYMDLYVDLVYGRDGLRVVDSQELEEAVRRKILSSDFVEAVNGVIDYLKKNVDKVVEMARGVRP